MDLRFTAAYLVKPGDMSEYLYSLFGSECNFHCEVSEPQSEDEPSYKLVTMVRASEEEVSYIRLDLYHNGLSANTDTLVVKKLMKYISCNLLKIEGERIIKRDPACYQIQPVSGMQRHSFHLVNRTSVTYLCR